MSQTLQIVLLVGVVLYFGILIHLLRKRKLSLKYTLLWLFSGVVMLILALFPNLNTLLANLVGIYDPTNALFAIILFCGIMILVSITAIVSKLNEKTKRIIQSQAILEKRVRCLEQQLPERQVEVSSKI